MKSKVCIRSFVSAGLLSAAWATAAQAETNGVPGRVLYFNMDEMRGDALTDLVTGSAIGHAVNVRVTAQGKLNGACEFSAKNSYIQVSSAPVLNPKRMTLALWFRTAGQNGQTRYLFEKGAEHGYALSIVGGGNENARKGKLRATVHGRALFSDMSVADELWHHAAVTYDGETVKLYIDGALQKQTVSLPGERLVTSDDLTLGMNRSSPSAQEKELSFAGAMDELMIFDRALGEAEIGQLLAAARPRFTKQQVERRLRELKELRDRGLLLPEFYDRKVKECEPTE